MEAHSSDTARVAVAEPAGDTLKAVVFDFDGVLVDSEPLHYQTLEQTLAGYGIEIDEDEYRESYVAYDDREALRLAFERHGRPADPASVERAAGVKARAFEALIGRVELLPGARELVAALAAEVPVAIASGALTTEIEQIQAAVDHREPIATIVGADQVARTKPDPLPYAEAVSRLGGRVPGLGPADCLAFEDSIAGIASARGAGLRVVAVANTFPPDRLGDAHHVLESLEGLDATGARRLHGG
jgi:HAD superfamily hydrolase (TIGR01509 family)